MEEIFIVCSKCGKKFPKNEEFFELRKDTGMFRKQCKVCRSNYRHAIMRTTEKKH